MLSDLLRVFNEEELSDLLRVFNEEDLIRLAKRLHLNDFRESAQILLDELHRRQGHVSSNLLKADHVRRPSRS
jgi:hypothetical protein